MLIIDHLNTNPYFNIAAEEYLLKEKNEDFLILYSNEPSIIVGKHQNTLAEINYRFVMEKEIKVIRRISGGGTVFHDLGNLNFTFISNGKEGYLVDFKKFTKPLMEIIQSLGGDVKFEGKNDLRINNLKISGNAEHVYKNRVLHHGTLLINSDLQMLSEGLKVVPGKYTDNAVKSIRSKVANLNDFLNSKISVEEFKNLLIEKINRASYQYSKSDLERIDNYILQKYSTWDWNYGYSPCYEFNHSVLFDNKIISIHLAVENGIIQNCIISNYETLSKKFIGVKHEFQPINQLKEDETVWKDFDVWNFF